jgi:hypothetical protein
VKNTAKVVLPLALGLGLVLLVAQLLASAMPHGEFRSLNTGQHFLPPYGNPRARFGFDSGALAGYDVAQLHAGWYSNWSYNLAPEHPDGLVYVQLIRLKAGADAHDPAQVEIRPAKAVISQLVAAHPGALWLMGNEPDSVYQGEPILPEVYAIVYHDLYTFIKEQDPAAQIANGGIVQPTPCRLEYLDIVWDTYSTTYGLPMPVDVWNIHAFILREVHSSWGASTPPGVDPACAMDYSVEEAADMQILQENITAMRQWMKAKGYQDHPLIISEYGILWPIWFAPQFTPDRVSNFMTRTFDLFLDGVDPDLGYPADDHRLVQTWAWYSLSDDAIYNGYLFHSDSKTISPMGQAYAAYTAAIDGEPYVDLSSRVDLSWDPPAAIVSGQPENQGLLASVVVSASIVNLGKQPAGEVLHQLQVLSVTSGAPILDQEILFTRTAPARFEGLVEPSAFSTTLAGPALYEIQLHADAENHLEEPREWNNVATATLDLRPDLAPQAIHYRLDGSLVQSGSLELSVTVKNSGNWWARPVSGTAHLELPDGHSLGAPKTFAVPALNMGEQVLVTATLSWPTPEQDLYRLVVMLDQANELTELDEENNRYQLEIPITLTATLQPDVTTVLTSASGQLRLSFPPGAVRAPTDIRVAPMQPTDWETGLLKKSRGAFSLMALIDGQPAPVAFERPISVTWRYRDDDVAGLDEEQLRLFVTDDGETWLHAHCGAEPYRRDPALKILETTICRGGQFLFGTRYDLYLPFTTASNPTYATPSAPTGFTPGSQPSLAPAGPGSPLRLPRP